MKVTLLVDYPYYVSMFSLPSNQGLTLWRKDPTFPQRESSWSCLSIRSFIKPPCGGFCCTTVTTSSSVCDFFGVGFGTSRVPVTRQWFFHLSGKCVSFLSLIVRSIPLGMAGLVSGWELGSQLPEAGFESRLWRTTVVGISFLLLSRLKIETGLEVEHWHWPTRGAPC